VAKVKADKKIDAATLTRLHSLADCTRLITAYWLFACCRRPKTEPLGAQFSVGGNSQRKTVLLAGRTSATTTTGRR